MRGSFKDSPCLVQLCMLLFIGVCSICFATFVSQAYLSFFPYSLRAMLFLQNTLPMSLIAIGTQYLISDSSFAKSFGLLRISSISLIVGLFIFMTAGPFIDLLNSWNQTLHLPHSMAAVQKWMADSEKQMAELTQQLLGEQGWDFFCLNILQIAILAGICEELLFRGVIQKIMIRRTGNIHAGIWIAAAIFSAIHLQFFGFFPRMFLGALLGYLFVWGGSLWIPIIAHAVNNAMTIIVSHAALGKALHLTKMTGKASPSFKLSIASILLVLGGLYLLRKNYQRNLRAKQEADTGNADF